MIPPDLKETDRVKMKVVLKINASHGGRGGGSQWGKMGKIANRKMLSP